MCERHGENEGFFDKVKDFFTGESRAEEAPTRAEEQVAADEHDRNSSAGDRGDAMDPGADGLGSHDAVGAAEAEEGQRGEASDSLGDEIVDQSRGNEVFDEDAAAGGASAGADVSDDAVAEDRWDGSGEVPQMEVPESEAVQRHLDESGGDDGYAARHGGGEDSADLDEHEDRPATPDHPDDEVDTAGERAEQGEPTNAEREAGENADEWADSDNATGDESEGGLVEDEDVRREREESFAREHDPEDHDVAAGEEFRQPGDWAAGDDGPQVQDPDGTIHDPDSAQGANDQDSGDDQGDGGGHHGLRESSLDEIRDGGHGWGSAAPIGPDIMPIGHPVKAWYDTGSFVCEGDMGYDGAQPDVWFIDAEAAQRAGFRHGLGD